MTGGSNNRYGGSSDDGEPIEPDLAALGRRLDHDGGTWRRGLADEQRVAQRVMAAISAAAPTSPAPPPGLAPGARMPPDEPGMPSQPGVVRRPDRPRRRGSRRTQRLLAVAAMLLVVILLAVVLKALGSRQAAPRPTATATATTEPTVTSTPSFPGAWSVAGTFVTPSLPNFAPSDPRIAYEARVQGPSKTGPATTSVTLQRTDDAGKTWHTLPLPPGLVVDNNLLDVRIVVSADDARTVYLYSARTEATCGPQGDRFVPTLPVKPWIPQGSGGVCLAQYQSSDGGATWATLTLPVPGVIAQVVYDSNGTLYALVAHPLYGSGNPLPDRLIASTDGGQTWHVADASLWAEGYGIVSMAVAPSIPNTDRLVSVWVVTNPVAVSQSQQAAPQFQPWRSDDGGATWRLTLSGPLPYQYSATLVAGAGALYQPAPPPTSAPVPLSSAIPAVSTDGGASWTKPPTAGLPSGASVDLFSVEPVVSGSTIIVPFYGYGSDGTAFYAWQPGAASWTQVAPTIPVPAAQLDDLYAIAAGGRTTLWAVYNALDGDGFTIASFTLK